MKNKKVVFQNLGLIDYKQAWDYQASLFNSILETKAANRNRADSEPLPTNNYLLFCEHPHVYTLGKSGDEKNLLLNQEGLKKINATYYHINRGGDITYHGPGQWVVYPVIDLENFFTDIHQYMRLLEEAVIRTCAAFGVASGRIPGLTGVWMEGEDETKARKICALGVKTSRWVTMHGLAFNVNVALEYFKHIIPCGIDDKAVTSLQYETGNAHPMDKVASVLKQNLFELFEFEAV
jgi:lipoyl(octanoyl) transferase